MAASDQMWRKSTRSTNGTACVEFRDSKDPDGPVLTFSTTSWTAFIDEIKAGGMRG